MARMLTVVFLVQATIVVVLAQSPRVTVNEGNLVGKTVEFSEDQFINITKNIDMYLGVPYANPPVRFAAPEPKDPWTGDWNATEFSAECQQLPSVVTGTLSEDCLYLNVYTPSPKPTNAAVMVWIHGGGFSQGTAMTYDYYGVPLVAVGDVIVVTLNYRLAIFAHLSTEDDEAPGNYGMLDQVAALKWVHENIEAFGGNPDQITIFGESAGSASVSYLVLSQLSRGYFNQAIYESGTAFSTWAFDDNPRGEVERSQALGRAMNCTDVTNSAALVSCLRAVEDPVVLNAAADEIYLGWYPVTVDGSFLTDTPAKLYGKGDFANVPAVIGFNKDEGTLNPFGFLPDYVGSPTPPYIDRATAESFLKDYFLAFYGWTDDVIYDAIVQEYTDWTVADDPAADYFNSVVDFGGDVDFVCPSDLVLRTHATAGGTVYQYYFTHEPSKSFFQYGDIAPSTPWLGAGHAEELTFVFGMPFIDQLYTIKGHNMTDEENALSVKMMAFWTNFAKSGDPGKANANDPAGDGENYWPLFTIPELNYKELNPELREGRAARASQCHFWNAYIPTLKEFANSIDDSEKEWRDSYDDWKADMSEWQQVFEEYQQQPTCN